MNTPGTASWRKSSHSDSSGEIDCVELANLGSAVGIRDSKNPDQGHLTFSRQDLGALVRRIKSRELEL